MMKIGAMVESFRKGFRGGVETAAKIGAAGVQVYATFGELKYDGMTKEKIREALDILKSNGLVFSAVCGELGGLTDEKETPARVEITKKVLDLAKELGCSIVTAHIGRVPEEKNAQRDMMYNACREIGLHAGSLGSVFALETGNESAPHMLEFIESLGTDGIKVNFDPANLVMVAGVDPVKGVHTLKKHIVHTHAKDGVRFGETNTWQERPLGQGGVDFDGWLTALNEIGYDGFLTIEREGGENPEADVIMAADFLRGKLDALGLNKG